jgi:hypothetical protein
MSIDTGIALGALVVLMTAVFLINVWRDNAARASRDPLAKYGPGDPAPMKLIRGTCGTCGRAIRCWWDLDPELLASRRQHWFLASGPSDTSHMHEPVEAEVA